MLEDLLNMTFSPPMIGAIVVGFVLFSVGRASKGGGARKREEELKRDLLEAKASVPQLESSVRNRDQQISRLQEEVNDLNDRTNDLLRGQDEKGNNLRRAEREIKNLTSELNAVRGVRQDDNNSIIMDGFDDEAAGDPSDSAAIAQLKKLEALYDKLKGALITRDARIEELETQLASGEPIEGGAAAPSIDPDAVADEIRPLEQKIADQQTTIDTLQDQISELRREKEMLDDLANRRSRSNRALKDASAEAEAKVPVLEQEITARDETIQTREASIKRMLNEAEEAKAEIVVRDEKIEALKSEIVDTLNAAETSESRQRELETSLERREERITALDTELSSTLENVERLQKELREADSRIEKQQSRVDEIDEELRLRDQAADTLQSTIKDRDFRIDTITNEKTALEEALEKAKAEAAGSAQEVETIRREAEDSMALFDKRKIAAESEQAATEQQSQALRREIEDLKANLTQHEQWMEKLKANLEDRETRAREQSERIEALQADLDQATEQARARHDERQTADDSRHELERELVTLTSRIEQIQAELNEQAQTITVYKSMLADKEFRIESLEQELQNLTGSASAASGNDSSEVTSEHAVN
jgi:chromosome segregation ATPase